MHVLNPTTCDLLLDACLDFEKTIEKIITDKPVEPYTLKFHNSPQMDEMEKVQRFLTSVNVLKGLVRQIAQFPKDAKYNF